MKPTHSNIVGAKRVTIKGKRMVMLEEAEFDRLLHKADEFEPLLPDPLPKGNFPAVEYLRASLAIDIIRHRLSKAEIGQRSEIHRHFAAELYRPAPLSFRPLRSPGARYSAYPVTVTEARLIVA